MAADTDTKGPLTTSAASDTGSTSSPSQPPAPAPGESTKYGATQRGLTPRHVQLMAIGGSIGTGLFVGIGVPLSRAGPISVVLAYVAWSLLFVWPAYLCVAEMMAYLPVRGTVFELASRFVDPALGFALGWTYFFAGAMLVCTEYAAVATVMQYWVDPEEVNPAVWVAVALVVCQCLNVIAVRWYGESEFCMASTKIILLLGLVLLTFITMVGGNPRRDVYGFRHWTGGNAFHPYHSEGATGRFLGWWSVVRYAAFTVAGPDLVALAAGEIQNPRRTIPRVAKLVFYRLVGFYILGVLCVGIICSSRDNRLLGAIESGEGNAAASPWVIGIQNLGISGLPSLINAVILLSGWSCGNAYLYSSSRTLYSLARTGQAPKFLRKCTKSGAPVWCVTAVNLIGCITFLVASNNSVTVLFWFIGLTTCALVLTYIGMLWTYLGWFYALKEQGISRVKGESPLPYIAPLAPYSAYFAFVVGWVVVIFIGFDYFEPWDTQGFITSYFGLPFGVIMGIFWKFYKKTKYWKPHEVDLVTGKKEIDEECKHWEEGGIEYNEKIRLAAMPAWRRWWERLW